MEPDTADARSRRMRVLLTPDADAPATARRALRALALGDREDDVVLLASELVTNAVVHAGLEPDQAIELSADCDPAHARVEVRDEGRGFRLNDARDGYGLHVVAAAATSWGVEHDGATRVWFELR